MIRRTLCLLWLCLPAMAAVAAPGDASPSAEFLLYASPHSQRALAERGFDQRAQVNRWRDLLRARQARYQIVTSIERLARLPRPATLVLPSAIALDAREREVIATRLAQGDHLIATAVPGLLDAAGEPAAGPSLLAALFPTARAGKPQASGQFLAVSVASPLTADPAGTARIWVDPRMLELMPNLAAPADAYLADWSRIGTRGVMTHATVGASRRVLLGWPEAAWESDPATFAALAGRAIDWAANRPLAAVATWPLPYRAAMTIGVDATWRFELVPAFAQLLARHEVRGSFHFLGADAADQQALIARLRQAGHGVGTLGDRWQPFAGQAASEQAARVASAVRSFSFSGLRAPEGRTDDATELATRHLGYLIDSGRVDGVLPLPASATRPSMLNNPLNLSDALTAAQTTAALQALSASLVRLGGHAYVGVDAAHLAAGQALASGIDAFLASPERRAVWLTDADTIVRWMRARDRVSLGWEGAPTSLQLTVRVAPGDGSPLPPGMTVLIHAPAGHPLAALVGNDPPRWFDLGDGAVGIDLSGRIPGEYLWDVRLTP